ncbi:Hypothetical protein R9X50_00151200 [Acrodontium crateriforme]|uniref:L-lactate dehydrogenase (cytochrome) n=1 Tax=Acrodontium crateriforme TaxID=150365 RepID=A0AAQ3LZL7_9PEZI|nr:Hypothetical protein R9X50_00151200 [Acrodontium crateriforme]
MTRIISVGEISKHNSSEDCWVVIDGHVWDMTEFAPNHPGGSDIIWKYGGRDATKSYSSIHAPSLVVNKLDQSKLKGRIDPKDDTSEWSRSRSTANQDVVKQEKKPPLESLINAQDFEDVAEQTAARKTWAFYSSASTDCITRDANRSFFARIWFRPRLARSVGRICVCTHILGHEAGLPIFVSPAAMAKMMHPDGEKAIARGCISNRVPQCVSTSASYPIEEVVSSVPKSANHSLFFQLYVNKDRSKSEALLRQARSIGIDTIFVTLDGPIQGKREADERVKADESLRAPMSGQKAKNDRHGGGIGRIMGSYIAPDFTWEEFSWLRTHWDGKIVAKGIQSWQDAQICADIGLDAVMLSNHGGRNLDTYDLKTFATLLDFELTFYSSPPSIMTLLECQRNCPSIFSRLEVYIDGGIRRGTDILKCLCLGATAVGISRPFLYAVNYGQEGVEHFIDIIKAELETAMALVGITDLDQCDPKYVNTADLDWLVSRGENHPYAVKKRINNGGRRTESKL